MNIGKRPWRLSQQIHFLDGNGALTSGPKFVTLRPRKSTLSASDSGPNAFEGQKRFRVISIVNNFKEARHGK
jgi:hypothetical protein